MKHVRGTVLTAALAGSIALAGCGEPERQSGASSAAPTPSSTTPSTTTAPSTTSTTTSRTSTSTTSSTTRSVTPTKSKKAQPRQVVSGLPTRLSMPSLGFDQPVRSLGLTNGAINPPPHVVQWYTGSPRPGSRGISVIAGHVGAYEGRAGIFSPLPRLSVGDRVTISYAGGGQRTFKVYAKEAVGKDELQRDERVWGKTSRQVLALITCDSSAPSYGGHSVRNFVVWAAPV
jgi:LPXTG-site transpeptidase (sortase) family protein